MSAKLSYVHGAIGTALIGETIGGCVRPHRRALGRLPCADRAAAGRPLDLSRAGRTGRCVRRRPARARASSPASASAIWSPNNAEWVVTQFATAKAGLILVNINPAYRLAELEYALNKVGCRALITATAFKTSDYIGMLNTLAPELRQRAPGQLRRGEAAGAADRDPDRRPDRAGHDRVRRVSRPWAAPPNARGSPNWPSSCNSTIRSTSSSPPAPPGCRRARR